MSLINDGIDSFEEKMIDIIRNDILGGLNSSQPNNSNTNNPFPIPLSKEDRKAFVGLCSLEGKPVKEKIAELMKNYIEEKRKQMGT